MQYEDVLLADERLKGVVHRTPLEHSRTFSAMTGTSVWMKLENLQRTGAFKIRGAFNKIAQLSEAERANGIITASAGNHAQGVASAAAYFQVPSTVVMPVTAPLAKIQATEGYGSQVVLIGQNYDEAYAAARRTAEETGAVFVHAFDDPFVIAGQGTIGLEMLEENPELDTLVVPVGGGGLIAGIAVAAKALKPGIRVIGVQPERSSAAVQSFRSGRQETIASPSSIADGLLVKSPGRLTIDLIRRYVDDMVCVTEEEIMKTIRLFLERSKLLVEGAGAAAMAALFHGRVNASGGHAAVVVSGGNIDVSRLAQLA